jgi:hypothetical protein
MSFKIDQKIKEITDVTVQRQCEWGFLDQIEKRVKETNVVLYLGCGIGVQVIVGMIFWSGCYWRSRDSSC